MGADFKLFKVSLLKLIKYSMSRLIPYSGWEKAHIETKQSNSNQEIVFWTREMDMCSGAYFMVPSEITSDFPHDA